MNYYCEQILGHKDECNVDVQMQSVNMHFRDQIVLTFSSNLIKLAWEQS